MSHYYLFIVRLVKFTNGLSSLNGDASIIFLLCIYIIIRKYIFFEYKFEKSSYNNSTERFMHHNLTHLNNFRAYFSIVHD